jgi:hypothetical protein
MSEQTEALKARHDRLMDNGLALMKVLEQTAEEVLAIRDAVKLEEPDGYDEIKMLFAGKFYETPKE